MVDVHRRPLRRSCEYVGLSRAAWYRPPLDWTVRDAELIAALAGLVEDRPGRGFWKCRKLLRRSRPEWNHKRIYRVYKAMHLNLRRAAKRRLPKRERVPLYVPRLPDTVWSADFVSDALACGRRFRTFNVVDDFNREALHIEVDTSITSQRLVRIFEQLKHNRGLPQVLRTDNVLTVESSSDTRVHAAEAVLDVLCLLHPLSSEVAHGLPRSRRSPDLTIMNTRSGGRPRPYLKQHGVPWKARTLSTGS